MGLLDGILGNVLGSLTGGAGNAGLGGGLRQDDNPLGAALGRVGGGIATSALMAMAFRVLQQNGGITGLIEKLRASGLGQHAASWVGSGANLPLTGEQLQSALGSDELAQLASGVGLTPQQASGGLAQLLPELVNQLTPAGQVPDNHHDMISEALSMLAKRGAA